jgi:hypothetical protein
VPSETEARELALDRCIDELLRGRDWSSLLGEVDEKHELGALMGVAVRVHWLARRSPPPSRGLKERIWNRISRVAGSAGPLVSLLRARSRVADGWPGAQELRSPFRGESHTGSRR